MSRRHASERGGEGSAVLEPRFRENLRMMRGALGMTQKEFGEAFLSCNGSYVSQIEGGVRFVTMPVVERLAETTGVDPAVFFQDNDSAFWDDACNGKPPARREKPVPVLVRRLPGNDFPLPSYQTEHAAGVDLFACIPEDRPVDLSPMVPAMVPTGISVAVPEGYELQIRPRSGLAIKRGVTVVNSPGTVDSDYRGEVMVGLVLLSPPGAPCHTIRRGERIAQAVLKRCERIAWTEAVSLPGTERGEGGFGSTGT